MTNLVFWICALVHHDAWDCVPARTDAGLILSAPEPEKLPVPSATSQSTADNGVQK